jgi:hypothetical protein
MQGQRKEDQAKDLRSVLGQKQYWKKEKDFLTVDFPISIGMFPSSTSGSSKFLLGTKAANFHILQQVEGSRDCNSYFM